MKVWSPDSLYIRRLGNDRLWDSEARESLVFFVFCFFLYISPHKIRSSLLLRYKISPFCNIDTNKVILKTLHHQKMCQVLCFSALCFISTPLMVAKSNSRTLAFKVLHYINIHTNEIILNMYFMVFFVNLLAYRKMMEMVYCSKYSDSQSLKSCMLTWGTAYRNFLTSCIDIHSPTFLLTSL